MPTEADCPQADQETTEGGDKPPHDSSHTPKPPISTIACPPSKIPPSPSSEKTLSPPHGTPHQSMHSNNPADRIRAGSTTPPSVDSPSITLSESEGWASANPSRNPSRAPSFSGNRTEKVFTKGQQPLPQFRPPPPPPPQLQAKPQPPPGNKARRPAPSENGGQKFNLKDLLAGSPGLVRRASQRSAGSKQSGSERGASSIGETTASLSKKYGVCERLAIGKGATSVVRLVHKWDRTQEKLYAVKVRKERFFSMSNLFNENLFRNFAKDEKMKQKRST